MVQLTMAETVLESKMLGMLQYLCNSSVELMMNIVHQMAEHTTTAGQELLRYSIYVDCLCVYIK